MNKKVVAYSLLALFCLFLTAKVHYVFIIPVLALIWLNQRELMKKVR